MFSLYFFFNDTATTEIYTLSLHDALPIWPRSRRRHARRTRGAGRSARPRGEASTTIRSPGAYTPSARRTTLGERSEEHTSELQSRQYLVCRLLLEKKK